MDKDSRARSIIITDDQQDLPLILLPEVELVVLRRAPAQGLDRVLGNFDVAALRLEKVADKKRGEDYIDSDRLFLDENKDAADYPALMPVWDERNDLRLAFAEALRTDIYMTHLFIQPAIRPGQRDNTFHKDYCTGYASEAERRADEAVFLTVAHKGLGTEAIPAADAGHSTPYTKDNRASFHHPHTLSHLFCAQTHDVMVMKSGVHGTVHRSPHEGDGLRWWTFFKAENSIHANRRAQGREGMAELRAHYAALKP